MPVIPLFPSPDISSRTIDRLIRRKRSLNTNKKRTCRGKEKHHHTSTNLASDPRKQKQRQGRPKGSKSLISRTGLRQALVTTGGTGGHQLTSPAFSSQLTPYPRPLASHKHQRECQFRRGVKRTMTPPTCINASSIPEIKYSRGEGW